MITSGNRLSGNSESSQIAEIGMIGAVAQWCECLHGSHPLLKSLTSLANGLDAEIIALVRYGRGGDAAGRTVAWDRAALDVRGGRLDCGFARSLLAPYFDAARPGSLWFRSMSEEGKSPDLVDFHAARQLRELVVIPLESNARFIDTIEVHFDTRLRAHQQIMLNALGPVLARTWQNRAQGLFTESLLRLAPTPVAVRLAPILSIENPARLSRAEYRVGLMLSRGLSVDHVKAELGIRDSTLRTHLGNLYAKTGASNLSELVYRLTSGAPFGTTLDPVRLA